VHFGAADHDGRGHERRDHDSDSRACGGETERDDAR
jgi:hypothetical protein